MSPSVVVCYYSSSYTVSIEARHRRLLFVYCTQDRRDLLLQYMCNVVGVCVLRDDD
jgi:hypothetical protein